MYGRPFACHKKGGHGTVDLHKAIINSCNVFFYHVGQKLGIDKIAYWAKSMGLAFSGYSRSRKNSPKSLIFT